MISSDSIETGKGGKPNEGSFTPNSESLLIIINSIRSLQEDLVTQNIKIEEKRFIIDGIKFNESKHIVGKNKEERDAKLRLVLDENNDYLGHDQQIKDLKLALAKTKIELDYNNNLFSVHKVNSRYQLVLALSRGAA